MTTTLPDNIQRLDESGVQELRKLQFPLVDQLQRQDSVPTMLRDLPRLYPPEAMKQPDGHRIWELGPTGRGRCPLDGAAVGSIQDVALVEVVESEP